MSHLLDIINNLANNPHSPNPIDFATLTLDLQTLEQRDDQGNTALILATSHNLTGIAKKLLNSSNSINVNACNHQQKIPLFWAAYHGNTELALALLKQGATPFPGEQDGNWPIAIASRRGHVQFVDSFLSCRIIQNNILTYAKAIYKAVKYAISKEVPIRFQH